MPSLRPDEQFDAIKAKVEETLDHIFPIVGKRSQVELKGVEVRDNLDVGDLRGQKAAMRKGKTWSVPVYADLSLKRNGKEIDRKKVLIMHLPKTTDRFGYIVNGNEYQVVNQFRLKSGVYHRIAPNGDALAEFNLANNDQFANGKSFKIRFDPETAVFYLKHRNSNVPMYHLLKQVGVSDAELKRRWGSEILEKNKNKASEDKAVKALYRAVHGKTLKKVEGQQTMFAELLSKTKLLEETTIKTLGKGFTTVQPEVLLRSTSNLLELTKGNRMEDDKNSLEFQSIHSVEDLIDGQIRRNAGRIRRKVLNTIEKSRSVRSIVPSDTFDRVLKSFFSSSLANQPEGTNPLEMLSGQLTTTIMGEQGGIKSAHAVSDDAKLINPSHLAFLDPIRTPEGEKTGISLALPLGVVKKGNELQAYMRKASTGRRVRVTPGTALRSTVAFPDQYVKRNGKWKPRNAKVKATKNGEIVLVDPKEVDFVIPSPRGLFGISSNLIPYLQNNQGNRAMTAARQQEQAVPLEFREAPLVQVKTDKDESFEQLVGNYASRRSPVAGTVVAVKKDAIVIKTRGGKKREVQFYRDFGSKGKTLFDSVVKVKAGDKVEKGQLLADSTFTKDGVLALGTNLRTAYVPFFGYNFEDGIVISDKAAKKLTSLHMYPNEVRWDADTTIDRRKFLSQYPHAFNRTQVKSIGEDGVIQIGAEVKEGDPLVLALRKPSETQQRKQLAVFRRGRPDKWKDRSLVWDKPNVGIVTDVVKKGKELVVHVKTKEPAQVGDKLVGRHGNKGVITRIVPVAEMPYAADAEGKKRHIDIAMNPLGVPGRINLGQVLETAAGKIAEKNGKPYKVRNFEAGKNYLEDLKKELKAAGLTDKEEMIDPTTGKPFEQKILVGNQYILKLKQQAAKKMSARSGSGGVAMPYDINHAPAGGAPHGGQSMGELGLYALLAHGARENLHEMYAYKTNRNDDLWDALREGTPLPPPKVPFAYTKFLGYMNGLRLNVKKQGNHLQLTPFTERQVLAMSNGELKEPGLLVRGKDLRPIKGGLFDPDITGGIQGTRWSHFRLSEPLPNPVFEDAIKKLTGLTESRFRKVLRGEEAVGGKKGGEAIEELLRRIDVKKDRANVETRLKKAKGATRNKLHQKLRILKALDEQGIKPTIYMMRSVPVVPPAFRPITAKDDGALSSDDLNGLYKDIGAVNETLALNKRLGIPDKHMAAQRLELYDGVKALSGLGTSLTRSGEYRGILDVISGKTRSRTSGSRGSSKDGFFQRHIMKRRQDFSARSIIIPEPKQGLDELGLPEDIAWTMYQPFIEKHLIRQGYRPLDAIEEVKKRSLAAEKAMQRAVAERPVLLKRDPALHKFNVMAFKPRVVRGKAIEIHPLVTGGYNADFDGDAMSVYLPVTSKAVKEAASMYPSNNLFNPTTGAVMYTPGHEALLGMYLLSSPGKRTRNTYSTQEAAKSAERSGKIGKTDIIRVGGHETTVGRLLIEEILPQTMRETGKKRVRDMQVFDKRTTKRVLTQIAKKTPARYGEVANRFKDLGNNHSTHVGFSIGLDDFSVINVKGRDRIIARAEKDANVVRGSTRLSWARRRDKIIKIFSKADDQLDDLNDRYLAKNPSNISRMVDSGSRGSREQLKQIISTPALVKDAKDQTVPYLIPMSYSEGMDVASYWTTLHGARKGTVQKVQGVREPGYLSKQIINSTMNQLITEEDCRTNDGIDLSVSDNDILDRYLSKGVRLGTKRYRAGTLVTPEMLAAARRGRRGRLPVRSPLRCEAEDGICKKCMGLSESGRGYSTGTNIGVISAQAIGEPSTQLSLNTFHTGGLAKGRGSKSVSSFDRLSQILRMPRNVPNTAPLALSSGKVTKIEKAPQGGEYIYINKVPHYVPASQTKQVKLYQRVRRGDSLSDGVVDPKKLLPLKGVRSTQDYLADALHSVLATAAPVRRRNVEVVVKAMTNVTRIDDAGDHPDWVTGDVRPSSQVGAWNARSARGKRKKIQHTPIIKGVDVLPTEVQEDWVARLNFQNLNRTLTQAAREGWRSNIHGFHPVPAVAHATEFGRGRQKLGPGWRGQY